MWSTRKEGGQQAVSQQGVTRLGRHSSYRTWCRGIEGSGYRLVVGDLCVGYWKRVSCCWFVGASLPSSMSDSSNTQRLAVPACGFDLDQCMG